MNQYRSLHPNHVHQLVVCVSKHYYAAQDGNLKYQTKPLEINLQSIHATKRAHMVTAVLRDHCSGLFFGQIEFGPSLPSIYDFLHRAWSLKPQHPLRGLPDLLTVPESVENAYPGLRFNLERLGIRIIPAVSGFRSGVKDIHTIESSLSVMGDRSIEEAKAWVGHASLLNSQRKARTQRETKAELWARGVPVIRELAACWPNDA